MKALVYRGPQDLHFEDFDSPVWDKNKGEVLLEIKAVSICGSDMHAYFGHDERRPAPLILGHEAAGIIVDSADKSDIGLNVAVNPLVTCGVCDVCKAGRDNLCSERQIISMPPRQGAFCQYLAMPRRNLIAMPSGFSMPKATLCEPVACGRHAVNLARQAYQGGAGDIASVKCLIFGGGAIGLGTALNLRCFGHDKVTIIEPNPGRARFIQQHYDFEVIEASDGGSYGMVFDAYGGQATRTDAMTATAPGGVIIMSGLADNDGGFDFRRQTLQEITVIGAYTYSADDYRDTAKDIFEGGLGDLIGETWQEIRPLAEGVQAFQDIVAQKVAAPKITLIP